MIFIKGLIFVCVGDGISNLDILLHAKSEKKVIGD